VRCLYCGKEIGAFRLLRDSEFCGAAHRKSYGERIGKALHQLAAPEPPPAPVANFVSAMPVQVGRISHFLAPSINSFDQSICIPPSWPLAIEGCLGQRHRQLGQARPAIAEGLARIEANLVAATCRASIRLLNTFRPQAVPKKSPRSTNGGCPPRPPNRSPLSSVRPQPWFPRPCPPGCRLSPNSHWDAAPC